MAIKQKGGREKKSLVSTSALGRCERVWVWIVKMWYSTKQFKVIYAAHKPVSVLSQSSFSVLSRCRNVKRLSRLSEPVFSDMRRSKTGVLHNSVRRINPETVLRSILRWLARAAA